MSRTRLLPALSTALALATSCKRAPDPTPPEPEPVATATTPAPSSAPPAPSASAPGPAAAALPLFVLVEPPKEIAGGHALTRIEGAVVFVDDRRVGRIVGESVEWIRGTVPAGSAAVGGNRVEVVLGRYPDAISVLTMSNHPRVAYPTWFPYTGAGTEHDAVGAIGYWSISGEASVGASRVLMIASYGMGDQMVTVRGPEVARKFTSPTDAGCKLAEFGPRTALNSEVFAGTSAGTLIAVGTLCRKGPAAEVWDKAGEPRIVDLSRWIRKVGDGPSLLVGKGDEAWLKADGKILHYRNGTFEPIAGPGPAVRNLFASETGELHASAGRAIWRLRGKEWSPIARLAWPTTFTPIVLEGGRFWVQLSGGIKRLAPGDSAVELTSGCKTPFVHLSDVSREVPPQFGFPATKKALSSFAEVADLELVDFEEQSSRRLGVKVKNEAQANALIAHFRTAMPEDDPKLLCYAPKKARRLDVQAKPGR